MTQAHWYASLLAIAHVAGALAEPQELCPTERDPNQPLKQVVSGFNPKFAGILLEPQRDGSVHVRLHASPGDPTVSVGEVRFVGAKGDVYLAPKLAADHEYLAEVKPGRYALEVRDPSNRLVARRRAVDVGLGAVAFNVTLGPIEAPVIRLADDILPMVPADNLVAISFEFGFKSRAESERVLSMLETRLPLRPARLPVGRGPILGIGEVIVMEVDPSRSNADSAHTILDGVRRLLPPGTRVGVPAVAFAGSPLIVDNQFVVDAQTDDATAALTKNGATVARRLPQGDGLLQITFPWDDFRRSFAILECLIDQGYLRTAEPDLIFEFSGAALPGDFPNDARYPAEQAPSAQPFGRQKVRQAWSLLEEVSGFSNIGRATINLGILETGLDISSYEFNCSDSSGAQQIGLCWDAYIGNICAMGSPNPLTKYHGTSVAGIAAACVHNRTEIAGMAPGTQKTLVQFPKFLSGANYADLLRWVTKTPSGGAIDCPPGPPANHPCVWSPIAKPTDIINNSYGICAAVQDNTTDPLDCGFSYIPLPTSIGTTFTELVTQGRGGKGVVLVYAAGNRGSNTLDQSPFARDYRAIGVSNCMIDGTLERLTKSADENLGTVTWGQGSSSGAGIDLCAIGHKAPTVQVAGCFPSAGACLFGGTSAATPQVSAAAALALSANDALTSASVRMVLGKTADKVDLAGGNWSNGYSPKYGFGRLNVCEAVRASYLVGTGLPLRLASQCLCE
jgi:subtilisin family serine protease